RLFALSGGFHAGRARVGVLHVAQVHVVDAVLEAEAQADPEPEQREETHVGEAAHRGARTRSRDDRILAAQLRRIAREATQFVDGEAFVEAADALEELAVAEEQAAEHAAIEAEALPPELRRHEEAITRL